MADQLKMFGVIVFLNEMQAKKRAPSKNSITMERTGQSLNLNYTLVGLHPSGPIEK